MANKLLKKKYSTSVVLRKIQIKTINVMSYLTRAIGRNDWQELEKLELAFIFSRNAS